MQQTNTKMDFEDTDAVCATNPASLALALMRKERVEFAYGDSRCVECREAFRYRWAVGMPYAVPTMCGTCHDAWADREHRRVEDAKIAEERERRRRIGVPAEYADNDPDRFPTGAWLAVQAWGPKSGRGLGLIGATGQCKTRMMYRRLVDIRTTTGIRFVAMTSFRLQQAIQHQWGDDECKKAIKKARMASILFLDDLGKQKFTESAEAELFDIIEERTACRRPVCFTSNLTGEDLKRSLSENVADPLLRRLRDYCEILVVK